MAEALQEYIAQHSYKENHEQLFTLASGRQSPYYFDLKRTLFQPAMLELAIEQLYEKIKQELGGLPAAVSGLTMGADALIYGIALRAWREEQKQVLPIIARKEAKSHGQKRKVEGLLDAVGHGEVVLLDDVITTGGSTLKAYEALKGSVKVDKAFCVVDRKEGGLQNMKDAGVTLYSLYTVDDFRNR